jgi:hypothetical protein
MMMIFFRVGASAAALLCSQLFISTPHHVVAKSKARRITSQTSGTGKSSPDAKSSFPRSFLCPCCCCLKDNWPPPERRPSLEDRLNKSLDEGKEIEYPPFVSKRYAEENSGHNGIARWSDSRLDHGQKVGSMHGRELFQKRRHRGAQRSLGTPVSIAPGSRFEGGMRSDEKEHRRAKHNEMLTAPPDFYSARSTLTSSGNAKISSGGSTSLVRRSDEQKPMRKRNSWAGRPSAGTRKGSYV